MKKMVLIGMLSLSLVFGSTASFASSTESNFHITEHNPAQLGVLNDNINGNVLLRGSEVSKSTWNIEDDGEYEFEGFADWTNLFTEYKFTGKTSYTISVTNEMKKTNMKVIVYKERFGFDKKLKTLDLKYQKTKTFTVSGLDEDDEIYIEFDAPADFNGNIE